MRISCIRLACVLSVLVAGCPEDEATAAPHKPRPRARAATHAGLISIQDISISGLPQAGHGLTVQAFFTPARAPDFEQQPGAVFGCKVSAYDLATEPLPAEGDQGRLRIDGIEGGQISCGFVAGRGYVCPRPVAPRRSRSARTAPTPCAA